MSNEWWKNLKLWGIVVSQIVLIVSALLGTFGVPQATADLVLKIIGALDVLITAVLAAVWGLEVGVTRGVLIRRTQGLHIEPPLPPRRTSGGQGLVEYALILVLVSVVVIVVLAFVGTQVSAIFSTIASALTLS